MRIQIHRKTFERGESFLETESVSGAINESVETCSTFMQEHVYSTLPAQQQSPIYIFSQSSDRQVTTTQIDTVSDYVVDTYEIQNFAELKDKFALFAAMIQSVL